MLGINKGQFVAGLHVGFAKGDPVMGVGIE